MEFDVSKSLQLHSTVDGSGQATIGVGRLDDVGVFSLQRNRGFTSTDHGPLFLRALIARGTNEEFLF